MPEESQAWRAALPLYGASLVVTLAGVGAVGTTMFSPAWTPIWAILAVLGHVASLLMRRMRFGLDQVFYPIMLVGSAVVLQLLLTGSPLLGMDSPLSAMPPDMITATAISALAVVRSFTLVTNSALLFSPVPAITMLALTGSNNINAEIPLFFGLLVFGSLFCIGYEAHLRRIARTRRAAVPVVYHLLSTWCITLLVAGTALIFPLLIQPVIGPLSPFALPGVNRFRALLNFTQVTGNQAPVGQGPIRLSANPVYELYSSEGGRYRTNVFTRYTGRSWTMEPHVNSVQYPADGSAGSESFQRGAGGTTYQLYAFRLPPDPELMPDVPVREVRHRFVTRGFVSAGIPALGHPFALRYPRATVQLLDSGCITGTGHQSAGRVFEVVSQVPEFDGERLRRVPAVDPEEFRERMPETLTLPQSTLPVQELARKVTAPFDNSYDKVQALVAYIQDNCRYTLEEEVTPPGEDAAAYYLFTTKRGACDLAATAVAVMSRAVGIPARIAVGYVAEERLPEGNGFLLRQEHAHMWTEVYFEGHGWVPFDPAPPLASIRDNPFVVAFQRLTSSFRRIGGGGLDAVLLVLLVIATAALAIVTGSQRLFGWMRARHRGRQAAASSPSQAMVQLYERALLLLTRRGWAREPWMTPREYLAWLRREWQENPTTGSSLKLVETLSDGYQKARYAEGISAEELSRMEQSFTELRRILPRRPRTAPVRPKADEASTVAGTA